MKIGIMGGSFNPPHLMHKKINIDLIKNKYVDKIIVVPVGDDYDKDNLLNIKHRYQMAKLNFEHSNILVSDYELKKGKKYTYELLDHFKKTYPNDELYFIIGADNLEQLSKWKNYKYMIENYNFIVIGRPNYKTEDIIKHYDKYGQQFFLTNIITENISSTLIREKLFSKDTKLINSLLDRKVYNYILKNNLYKEVPMNERLKKLIKLLTDKKETLSLMESCTGGALANAITDVSGVSEVFCFSAVTYAEDYKIKMGVKKEIIDKYTVYSIETARAMAYSISLFANSDYGVGITGKLNDQDNIVPTNDNKVDISIYDKKNNRYTDISLAVTLKTRRLNKEVIIEKVLDELLNILELDL